MTAQRLEKWLEAAEDEAAQDGAVNYNLAHSWRARDPLCGRGADETDLHALAR